MAPVWDLHTCWIPLTQAPKTYLSPKAPGQRSLHTDSGIRLHYPTIHTPRGWLREPANPQRYLNSSLCPQECRWKTQGYLSQNSPTHTITEETPRPAEIRAARGPEQERTSSEPGPGPVGLHHAVLQPGSAFHFFTLGPGAQPEGCWEIWPCSSPTFSAWAGLQLQEKSGGSSCSPGCPPPHSPRT